MPPQTCSESSSLGYQCLTTKSSSKQLCTCLVRGETQSTQSYAGNKTFGAQTLGLAPGCAEGSLGGWYQRKDCHLSSDCAPSESLSAMPARENLIHVSNCSDPFPASQMLMTTWCSPRAVPVRRCAGVPVHVANCVCWKIAHVSPSRTSSLLALFNIWTIPLSNISWSTSKKGLRFSQPQKQGVCVYLYTT